MRAGVRNHATGYICVPDMVPLPAAVAGNGGNQAMGAGPSDGAGAGWTPRGASAVSRAHW